MAQRPEQEDPAAQASDGRPQDAPRRGRPRRLRPAGRDLSLAVGSAVVFAVLFLAVAFINPWALIGFIAVVMVIAMLEVDAAVRTADLRPPTAVVLAGGVAMLVGAFQYGPVGQIGGLVLTLAGVLVWALADTADPRPLHSAGSALVIALWIPFLASFLALLLRRPDGEWYVVITVALTAVSDIGAYAFGSQLGRHKLAPAVSPGKTWEGVLGGMATTMLVAGIGAPLIIDTLSIGRAVALGAVVAVVATVGDLAESAVKRSLGIKDLGNLLPGHGGMMDRVDAMLFTLPVAHLVLLAGGL
ncbi:MAG TPA: phosphatidate cytidylyltransferase [Euzebyales bacterium]|nr:phosphatidate cytidylyltransferase [Euzebyales bacterium]